jgi:hypothetical protein
VAIDIDVLEYAAMLLEVICMVIVVTYASYGVLNVV